LVRRGNNHVHMELLILAGITFGFVGVVAAALLAIASVTDPDGPDRSR
jgi:hypothetical protein